MNNGFDDNNAEQNGVLNHDEPSTTTDSSQALVQHPPIVDYSVGDWLDGAQDDGPPAKKQKLIESLTPQLSSSRAASPPWKKITVEGPTSFVEGGRRKSSRTNHVPLDLQPQTDKRQTRRAAVQGSTSIKSKYGGASKLPQASPLTPTKGQPRINGKHTHSLSKSSMTNGKPGVQVIGKSPGRPPRIPSVPNATETPVAPPKRSHKKKIRPPPISSSDSPEHIISVQPRRLHRAKVPKVVEKIDQQSIKNESERSEEDEEEEEEEEEEDDEEEEESEGEDMDIDSDEDLPLDPNFKPQRLNFKVRMPTLSVQNPGHILNSKRFPSFREWVEQEDPFDGKDGARLTDAEARIEAATRQRLLEAGKPGGALSMEKCSLYIPEPQEQLPRQYTHHDHLLAHVTYFRKLMNKERRDHAISAKKLAYAALAKWKLQQPEEKVIVNKDSRWTTTLKQVMQDISLKWELLRAEVNRRRMEKWEEQQQALDKQALNKVLEQSTLLLNQRRRRGSSGQSSGIDKEDEDDERSDRSSGNEDEGSEEESEDEMNMSSSQSESEEGVSEDSVNAEDHPVIDEIHSMQREPLVLKPPDDDQMDIDKANDAASDPPTPLLPMQSDSPNADDVMVSKRRQTIEPGFPEELDEEMLAETDESTDMEDDMGQSDVGSEDDEEDDSNGSEEDQPGLLGFLSTKELNVDKKPPSIPQETNRNLADDFDEDFDEVSLIPDATQVQTPSASNSEAPSVNASKESQYPEGEHHPMDLKEDSENMHETPLLQLPEPEHEEDQDMDMDRDSMPATPVSSKPLKTPVPSLLRGTLREYQHYGLDWLAGLYANGTNGILADEMGLGKTIQTISLLAHLAVEHEVWGPHLIIVPTSVMLNWEMEFKKFLPGFKILTYYGTQEERKQKRKGWLDDDKWNVCITSYQLVLQDQVTFKRRAWHYLVLDEAHNIKNFRSQRWQALLTFRTRARLLLTGTPLQNNLTELWSLMFFLMPSDSSETGIAGFADLQAFTSWFKKPVDQILEQGRETMDDEAKEIVQRLHGVLRPYLLRRLKADVEKQMPGKYEHVVYCKLSKRQRYLYDGFMSRSDTRNTLSGGNYLSIINCLMQLRKVCNHPDLFETRQIVTSFAMPKSAVADFEIKELLVRRRLLQDKDFQKVNLNVINLLPGANGSLSALDTIQTSRLRALGRLRQLADRQYGRLLPNLQYDGTSIKTSLAYMDNKGRTSTLAALQHLAYLTSLRSQRRPLYSHGLMERLRIDLHPLPASPMPKRRSELSDWFTNTSPAIGEMVLTLPRRAHALQSTIQKFACVTPAVVASDMNALALTLSGMEVVRQAQKGSPVDSFHEARMRLSIAFPDKRLLQYDCGKLQRLDTLLRNLQAGGHRALIFTQMTKVLDILEQFLNIHGHRYLRLDGSTKIEQRQILTDRFNNDNRILAFILSSRSGGLGINLTGADTVIFYDLDWNPAMDKQCQDRCHRIGQTRDVHIYRFVSEYTIEANILRKANQKRMLDDVIIQEGDFTTDYFTKPSLKDAFHDDSLHETDADASAAMDRILGVGSSKVPSQIFEQAEDKEDIVAAKNAEIELASADDADFDEKTSLAAHTPRTPGTQITTPSGPQLAAALGGATTAGKLESESAEYFHGALAPRTPMAADIFAEKEGIGVDQHIVHFLEWELRDVPVMPPEKKRRKKKAGEAHRVRRPG